MAGSSHGPVLKLLDILPRHELKHFGRRPPPRRMTSATLRLIAVLLGCVAPALGYTERGILKLDNTCVPPCRPWPVSSQRRARASL